MKLLPMTLLLLLTVPAAGEAAPEKEPMMTETEHSATAAANRLIHEKSPYLLQHARNPVDWYPWGPEAFEQARREDRPIFLSIGYSTCHWCHVMERESFEDPEVARRLNQVFLSIKVDREERPDVDSVYMTVCQLMTGSGGWPLTVMMTPDGRPFFAGTYFPKESRFGRVGLLDLIDRVEGLWRDDRAQLESQAGHVVEALQRTALNTGSGELTAEAPGRAREQLARRFDATHGGFGGAPKFPSPHNLLLLLAGSDRERDMAETTLRMMRRGGLWDHAGYGFHRYSTDRAWLVPHFEKMLYDQAMLALAYTEAYRVTRREEHAETARRIFAYLARDMTGPEGAFFSAEDADSEGEEGKFYLWSEPELRAALGDQAPRFIRAFGVESQGNFRDEASGHRTGANILHRPEPTDRLAQREKLSEDELIRELDQGLERLRTVRERRIRPLRDDKVLTDWNGLMIAALARAARVLEEPEYACRAEAAAGFLAERLRQPDGRLLHRFREGEASIPGGLDDYAFLTWGLIELHQTTLKPSYLEQAVGLTEILLADFWDDGQGGLFLTARDAERLLIRPKEGYDGAIPSGNSAALGNLIRLARLTGRSEWEERGAELARAFAGSVEQAPSGHSMLLLWLDRAGQPSREVVVVGEPGGEDTRALIRRVRESENPNVSLLLKPVGRAGELLERLAPFTKGMTLRDEKATAYVCQGDRCLPPTNDPVELGRLLAVTP